MVRNFYITCLFFILNIAAGCGQPNKPQRPEIADADNEKVSRFSFSLAQWSLHRAIESKKLDPIDFAAKARELGFDGIEYVSTFYKNKAKDLDYLNQLKTKAAENKVQSLLIMIDDEGDLGVLDEKKRNQAVENHYKWVDAASYLGCHSIRVNLFGTGTETEIADASVLALKKLSVYAKKKNINVIVENHGGNSSHGVWLSSVISRVNMSNCGTLPDFGNFCIERENNERWGAPCVREYDRYKGIFELMPFAKGVSAKSYAFDKDGNETTIDYAKMADIVKKTKFSGFIGIEWEGDGMTEEEGITATLSLVKKHFF